VLADAPSVWRRDPSGLVWQERISGYLRVFSQGDWVKTLLSPKTLCDTTIPFLINTLHKFICLVGRDKSTTKKIQLSQHAKYDRSNPNKNTVLRSCHKQQYLKHSHESPVPLLHILNIITSTHRYKLDPAIHHTYAFSRNFCHRSKKRIVSHMNHKCMCHVAALFYTCSTKGCESSTGTEKND
jgi:hypothetical protein